MLYGPVTPEVSRVICLCYNQSIQIKKYSQGGTYMFGNQNDQSGAQQDNLIPDQSIDAALDTVAPQTDPSSPVQPASTPPDQPWQHPTAPMGDGQLPAPVSDAPVNDAAVVAPTADSANDLIDIKLQALSQLSPLIEHLDQTPEEKFRTTMMMIQASDNQALIKPAYEAAQAIADEKLRAQALLDIINEINYFTQQQES